MLCFLYVCGTSDLGGEWSSEQVSFFLFSFSWISENVVTWRQVQIKVVYIVLSRRGVKIVGLVNLSRCLIVVRFLDVGAIFLFIVLSSCCYVEKDAGEGRT